MSTESSLAIVGDYLWDRALARRIDQATSADYGIAAATLMEVAGKAVADWLMNADLVDESPILVLAGYGNNGGDALVTARWLAEAGADVHVFLVPSGRDDGPNPLCAAQLKTLRASGFTANIYKKGALNHYRRAEPVILDGVYGIGFGGVLDQQAPAFHALSEAQAIPGATVVALDVPSGLDIDLGEAQRVPLQATVTLTFGGNKPALVLAPARDVCGEVICLSIGFPRKALEQCLASGEGAPPRPAFMLPDGGVLIETNPWQELPRSAHKYDRGHVLIIGGSAGKTGAPILAGMSALRCGAGWVSLAMPQSALATLRGDVPRELVFEDLFQGGDQLNSLSLAKFLQERKVRAVVIGPGMMENPLTPEVMEELAEFTSTTKGLVVLDAAATSGSFALLKALEIDPERWLLTPHPGEWTKLGPTSLPAPLSAKAAAHVKDIAASLGITLMYKGATPVVVSGPPEMPSFICDAGSIALARAGSGDLFAGAAGAHGAIGVSAVTSALRAQALIGWAAKIAAEKVGEHGVLAKDILAHIGKVAEYVASLEDGESA